MKSKTAAKVGRPRLKIECNNGKTYDGLVEVAEKFGVTYERVRYAITTGKPLVRDLVFWKKGN